MTSLAPTTTSYSVFQRTWWLDAVAPGQWTEITVNSGSEVIARWPLYGFTKYSVKLLVMPPLTPYLGPWIAPCDAKPVEALSREIEVVSELIRQLPAHDHCAINFHPNTVTGLPFHWTEFDESTRYTYRIDHRIDLDGVWSGFRPALRTSLRKAERQLVVNEDVPLSSFIDLNRMTFERQGLAAPVTPELIERLDAACKAQGARTLLAAEDNSGRRHAAVYLVHDDHYVYYLMGGSDPEMRSSGALGLLLWRAIRKASEWGKAFDFEGSMIPPIERFFRGFGGTQVRYSHITRSSPKARLAFAVRGLTRRTALARALRGRR